jgi:hypothetical protein
MRPPRTTTTSPSRDRSSPVRSPVRDSIATPSAVLDLQRLAGNQATRHLLGAPPPLADMVLRSGGTALPDEVRAGMEQRFGEDLGDVRMHVVRGPLTPRITSTHTLLRSDLTWFSGQANSIR